MPGRASQQNKPSNTVWQPERGNYQNNSEAMALCSVPMTDMVALRTRWTACIAALRPKARYGHGRIDLVASAIRPVGRWVAEADLVAQKAVFLFSLAINQSPVTH